MPAYAATYGRQSAPNAYAWYSVETPSVFREIKLPACDADWTTTQRRQHEKLTDLAERHGTHVRYSQHRRG